MSNILNIVKKAILMILGLFLYSVGILLTIHANMGAAPWDIFHLGMVNYTGLTLGQASQIAGVVIIGINLLLKEYPGWATIANMYLIGLFIDIIESFSLIPQAKGWMSGSLMMIIGILTIGWATFFYINTGWGAGPRDGLMLGLAKRFSTQVWKTRTVIEVLVVIGGTLLGEYPWVGTVAFALLIGPSVGLAYRIAGKDAKKIEHRTLVDDYKFLVSSRQKSINN